MCYISKTWSCLFTAFFLGTCLVCNGQAYLKLSIGYGIPIASQPLGSQGSFSFTTTLDPETGYQVPRIVSENENILGSYGTGFTTTGSFGYMFSEHLGVEGQLNYFHGKKYEFENTTLDSRLDEIVSASSSIETSYSRGILLSPLLKLSAGEGTITPYLLLGPVLGWVKLHHETQENFEAADEPSSSEERFVTYSGGMTFGARGVVGADFQLRRSVSLFAEIVVTSLNYTPKQSEVTRYTINDEDQVPSMPARQRKVIYVDKVTSDTEDPIPSENEPGKSPRISFPMSTIAANVGIKFTL